MLAGQYYKPKTEMVEHACRGPQKNAHLINTAAMFMFGINPPDPNGPAVSFSGLTIDQNMVKVPIVKVPHAKLKYGGKSSPADTDLAKGSWNLRGCMPAVLSSPQKYTLLELYRPNGRPTGKLEEFATEFAAGLARFGMAAFGKPFRHPAGMSKHLVQLFSSQGRYDHGQMSQDLSTLRKIFGGMRSEGIRLVLVILPDKDAELYGLVKRAGELQDGAGVHTICLAVGKNKTLREGQWIPYVGPKLDAGFMANLHMKFNMKLSRKSANQTLATNTDKVLTAKTMLVGIDVVSLKTVPICFSANRTDTSRTTITEIRTKCGGRGG